MKRVRFGVIGLGARGGGLLGLLLKLAGVEIKALCDTNKLALTRAQQRVTGAGRPAPAPYTDDDTDGDAEADGVYPGAYELCDDIDNDCDQDINAVLGGAYAGDLYQNGLFENPGHGHRWITLRLEGVKSNRAAIGARSTARIRATNSLGLNGFVT